MTTAEELTHAAEREEARLGALVDKAAERIAELANRLPHSSDERHDLRIDRENAAADYEAAQEALSAFWATEGNDDARAAWLAKAEAERR